MTATDAAVVVVVTVAALIGFGWLLQYLAWRNDQR